MDIILTFDISDVDQDLIRPNERCQSTQWLKAKWEINQFPLGTEIFLYALEPQWLWSQSEGTLGSLFDSKRGRSVKLTIKFQLVRGLKWLTFSPCCSLCFHCLNTQAQRQIHCYFYFCCWLIERVDGNTRSLTFQKSGLSAVQWRMMSFEHKPQYSFSNTGQRTVVTALLADRCLVCALVLKRIRFFLTEYSY
jgi:hypothetical protein